MKYLRAWLGAVCMVAAAASAHALPADPRIGVTVEPVPDRVTLARPAGRDALPLQTFAAWRITLTNGSTNALNRVVFDATLAVVGGSATAVFDSTVPSALACTGADTSRLVCSLGSLAPGASTSFHAVAAAPRSGTQLDLVWRAGGDEGNGKGNGCCDTVGTASTVLVDPATDPTFLSQVKSFVKPSGGVFFTGSEAVSTSVDRWTTQVRVPAFSSLPLTTASIVETPLDASCAAYALLGGCFVTDITIPGTFAALEIDFRWDKDYFRLGGVKPEAVKLYYEGSAGRVDVLLCSDRPAQSGFPCLVEPPRRLGSGDTANKALWGDLLFRVRALDNGRYAN